MQSFPQWKYYLLIVVLLIGFVYSVPNIYGEDPAVQVSGLKGKLVTEETEHTVETLLQDKDIKPKSVAIESENALMLRFSDPETQLKAKEIIKQGLGEFYSVALNLAPATPEWLDFIGAKPMKLGLDLRGGVRFLMEVDIDSVIQRRLEGYYLDFPKILREAKIRYKKIESSKTYFTVLFNSEEDLQQARKFLVKYQSELLLSSGSDLETSELALRHSENLSNPLLKIALTPAALQEIRHETLEQTMATLRNRVNELGVAEAIVQRQGLHRVVVELPGIQDTAYARDILGKTATLKFLMQDSKHNIEDVLAGHPALGSKLYLDPHQRPVLLKNQSILTGESITGASTSQDRDGQPAVSVRLGGDISLFTKTTRENIGKGMAVVYVEINDHKTTETLISLATIQSALGNNFIITGLTMQAARDLALLLRAGALPAPVSIVEESIIGPSMGQDNIRMGVISVIVGLSLVLIFMAFYYSMFGIIANLALIANLILLVAAMSLIGATLTLPGIAGIVLTLGMAVDANVLIFERIREELRLGVSPRASIHRGFEYAFATIVDSNLTTLIVGVILFAVGTGPVKGFAVTLCIGILTSLLTATTGSRALVELFYGSRGIKQVPVGV